MLDRRSTDPALASALRASALAVAAGLACGAGIVAVLSLSGRTARADLGALCSAGSPLTAFAAAGRPCDRLALNLVTLPYLTGLALLLPRLPGRLAVRLAHAAAAAAPAAVLAVLLLGSRTLLLDPPVLVVALGLGGLLLTGTLHVVGPLRARRRLLRPARAAHLALAALWLVVVLGSDLVSTLSAGG